MGSDVVLIYVLKCPAGEVRYVGKTANLKDRLRKHLHEAKFRAGTNHRLNWIRSLLSQGLRPTIELDTRADLSSWKNAERERIAHYKALGCRLTNATDGGDGATEMSIEARQRLSNRVKKYFSDEKNRIKHAEATKFLRDPVMIAKRVAARKITCDTDEYRAKASAITKAIWAKPGHAKRMSEVRKIVSANHEFRELLSRKLKVSYLDPDRRAQTAALAKAAWANPEIRARQVAAIREAALRRPAHNANVSAPK